jgi:uncharacterized protein
MEPRVSLVTLGVADLERSRSCYEALACVTRNDPSDGVVFFQSGDGRIAEHWGGPDLLDLLTQLGVTVEPGPHD